MKPESFCYNDRVRRRSGATDYAPEVVLLGPPSAGAQALPPGKPFALYAYLCAEARATPRGKLAALFWPEVDEAKARASLRQALRKLKVARLAGLTADQYSVDVNVSTDLQAFEDAVSAGNTERTTALYRGELLEDVVVESAPFNAWLENRRTGLRLAWRNAALKLARENGFNAAVGLLRRLLTAEPFDEEALQLFMVRHLEHGNPAEALRAYKHFRSYLYEELGLDPTFETARLAVRAEQDGTGLRPLLSPEFLRPPDLVGREDIWQELEEAYALNEVVYLVGDPGVGKSRLLLDFARSKGRHLLVAARPGDDVAPFQSLRRTIRRVLSLVHPSTIPTWVAEALGQILPDVFGQGRPGNLTEAYWWITNEALQRVKFVAADDMQFSDLESFNIYLAIIERIMEARTPERGRLVITARKGPWLDRYGHLIREQVAVGAAVRYRELVPLDASNVETLVARYAPHDRKHELFELTRGNPQFLIEIFKTLQDREDAVFGAHVQSIIRQRVLRLDLDARRVLLAAAVLNQEASVQTLLYTTGLSSVSLERALIELERRQLYLDFRFVHDLIHEAVLKSTENATAEVIRSRAKSVTLPRSQNTTSSSRNN